MQPASIAHYNILEPLGEGGLGPVYRARDTRVGRTVALKVVPAPAFPDAAARAQFLDAARAAAKLSHPNIATLFDVGEHDGGAYLAYEFASGVTVREEMAGRSVAPRRTVDIAIQIADALADGHAHGILHGDVRPDNIIITPKGSAKLLEFGLSAWTRAGRLRARAASAPASLPPDAMAIVGYMSPEQALGGAVDPRTDVFSLGVVLYEMLTGTHPFVGAGAAATIVNIIHATPAAASAAGREVPAEIDPLLARALAKGLDERQQSAASLSAELRSLGAMLDVRSGDAVEGDRVNFDDGGIGAAAWVAILVVLALLGAAAWYFL
jgi:serine/threonine protein kinase